MCRNAWCRVRVAVCVAVRAAVCVALRVAVWVAMHGEGFDKDSLARHNSLFETTYSLKPLQKGF